MRHSGSIFALILLWFVLTATTLSAAPAPEPPPTTHTAPALEGTALHKQPYVPAPLRPWIGWVLQDHEQRFCPSKAESASSTVCVFPASLELRLEENGARFSLLVHVYAEGRLRLPYADSGAAAAWPQEVYINDKPALVQEFQSAPTLLLPPGEWRIKGFLPWSEVGQTPDALLVPPQTGVVRLTRTPEQGGQDLYPDLAAGGKLRLSGKEDKEVEKRPEDSIQTRVFRLVQDQLPMRVTTLLRLDISGRARRILLEDALLPGSTPLAVQSPLPLQFAPDGGVYIQARPGRFDLRITSRLEGPVASIGPVDAPYGHEFWAFEAHDSLRVVEVQGVPGIDPQTTDMPQEWKRYPAYLVEQGNTVSFKKMHRGAPAAMPDSLNISRTLLLDFDGQGLTVRDEVNGTVRNDWTLAMLQPGELGRASLHGKDQPVVLLGKEELPGVELRQSNVQLVAESRYEGFTNSLPAAGWNREFDSVSARLQLPPGWELLSAAGADGVNDSWISRWSLLDIFLCLVIVLAVIKLQSFFPGFLALAFLFLAWQEPGAPRQVWLVLLAALALYKIFAGSERLAPYQTGRRLALWLYGLALVLMAVVAVPFVYQQVNQALYPQLEYAPAFSPVGAGSNYATMADNARIQEEMPVMQSAPAPRAMRSKAGSSRDSSYEQKAKSLMYDPEALVQTGPGLPDWQWRSVSFSWSGPVAPDEQLELWLLSPGWNLWLSLGRVLLLLLVLVFLVDLRAFRSNGPGVRQAGAVAASLLALVFCLGGVSAHAAKEQALRPAPASPPQEAPSPGPLPGPPPASAPGVAVFPPEHLLQQLEQRLLEPAPCFPACLSSPVMRLHLDDALLRLKVQIHAAAQVLAPLPRVSERWMPQRVLLDGEPARDLFRENQELYVALAPGVHTVTLEGPVPQGLSFQVAMPLACKQGHVEAPGWSVQGLSPAGAIQGALRLARKQSNAAALKTETKADERISYRIPPFMQIRREITLGLEWSVRTSIQRLSPPGEPVHLSVPLLPGESVLSEDVRIKDGHAVVQLGSQQNALEWNSRLERSEELELQAPKNVPWVETWQLSPANIWHLDISGIPETSVLGQNGSWRPTWQPWPGESVTVRVSRPDAAPGESMTIERASLEQRVGQRLDENELLLTIRASKGGRHVVQLSENAELTGLTASGRDLPLVAGAPGAVEFPVQPGSQNVVLRWRQPRQDAGSIRPPTVDLQHPAVNAQVQMHVPRDRWILLTWGGPVLGPAVKYWTYLLAALVFAFALGYLPWTPLKRWQWFLLAVGLSQLSPPAALCAVAWLPFLGLRREHYPKEGWFGFDVLQLIMLGLTTAGLVALYMAVELGLLGLPHMQVAGNGSYGSTLIWTQDRIAGLMPQPDVSTAPLWLFRVVMLAWSLWLAVSLLSWLRWGWDSFSQGGILRGPTLRMPDEKKRQKRSAKPQGEQKQQATSQEEDDFRLEDANRQR